MYSIFRNSIVIVSCLIVVIVKLVQMSTVVVKFFDITITNLAIEMEMLIQVIMKKGVLVSTVASV